MSKRKKIIIKFIKISKILLKWLKVLLTWIKVLFKYAIYALLIILIYKIYLETGIYTAIFVVIVILYAVLENAYLKLRGNRTAKNSDKIKEINANIDNIYDILNEND